MKKLPGDYRHGFDPNDQGDDATSILLAGALLALMLWFLQRFEPFSWWK